MKISQINIRNYKSIKELEIIFPDSGILTLVGPNNAGKSNVLRAINNLLGEHWYKGENAELSDFYMRDKNNNIEIELKFSNGRYVNFKSSEEWPKYFDKNDNQIYSTRGNVKEDFPCTYLPASRSIEKSLQFKSWELMGKIAKSFNDRAQIKKDALNKKFDEIIQIFDEVPEFNKFKTDFIQYFEEMQSDSPYRLRVDFKAFTPINYFRSINILANDKSINDQFDIGIEELGDGNKNLVLFALIRSYAKNFKSEARGILAIEEPEIYLHPQARRRLHTVFKEIVKNSSIQIIITTHSSSFLRTEDFFEIGVVTKKSDEGTKVVQVDRADLVNFCKQTGVPESKVNESNIVEYYGTTSNYRLSEGFFSKHIILVEGETEEMAIPIYLSSMDISCDFKGISILSVNGKNQIPKYWRLFKAFGFRVSVIVDSDQSKRPSNNGNLSKAFDCQVNEFTNVEGYKIINTRRDSLCEQRVIILEDNFEVSIRKDFANYCLENNIDDKYQDFEEEAKTYIKPEENAQKGAVARFIAKKLIDYAPKYVPKFVVELSYDFLLK